MDSQDIDGIASTSVQLNELRRQHRALDEQITRLSLERETDEIGIKRLKKRKLQLKDMVERLQSLLIPDLDA